MAWVTTVVQVQSLAWKLSHVVGMAKKKKKKTDEEEQQQSRAPG